MNTNDTTNPSKSVTRWNASLITDMEPEMMPPTNSPAMKINDIMITAMSFLKLVL